MKFLYFLSIHLLLRDLYSQVQLLFNSHVFTLHSPIVGVLKLLKFIEFKENISSVGAINYIAVYSHERMEI
jgi:hypothetical protein